MQTRRGQNAGQGAGAAGCARLPLAPPTGTLDCVPGVSLVRWGPSGQGRRRLVSRRSSVQSTSGTAASEPLPGTPRPETRPWVTAASTLWPGPAVPDAATFPEAKKKRKKVSLSLGSAMWIIVSRPHKTVSRAQSLAELLAILKRSRNKCWPSLLAMAIRVFFPRDCKVPGDRHPQ